MNIPLAPALEAGRSTADPGALGLNARTLRRVVARFRAGEARGLFPGGQLVIHRRGRVVVDEVVGVARGFRPSERLARIAVTPSTVFPVFAAGNPLLAISVALLESRGELDLNAPIARWLPEHAKEGREIFSTLDVLTHRTNLALSEVIPELISRITGSAFSVFVKNEIAGPLDLPALRFGAAPQALPSLARSYWMKRGPGAVGVAAELREELENSPHSLAAKGAGVTADAGTLARLYDMLTSGGLDARGRRFLPEAVVRTYTSPERPLAARRPGSPFLTARGFLLPSHAAGPRRSASSCFGSAGAYSALTFGDPKAQLSFSAVTNGSCGPLEFAAFFLKLAGLARAAVET